MKNMKRKVYFKSCGVKICGILSEPKRSERKLKDFCMVFCHGLGSSKKSKKIRNLTTRLNKHGIYSLSIDFFGHGESEGSIKEITINTAAKNIEDAISYLKKLGCSRFGIYGSSYGGSAAIIYSSKNKVEFICLLAPRIKYTKSKIMERLRKEGYSKEFEKDAKKTNLIKIAHKIKSLTLIVQGKKDDICLPIYAKQFFKKMKCERMVVMFDDADHYFMEKSTFNKAMNAIYNFILYNLPKQ